MNHPVLPNSTKNHVPIFLLVCVATFIAYFNSFSVPFQYDDSQVIRFNFSLRDLTDWKHVFLFEGFRPLLNLIFALNYQISGKEPFLYHAFNIAFHLIALALFFRLMRLHLGNLFAAAMATLFMAVHPLNTESVTYISGRSIVLCAIFYLAALACFDVFLQHKKASSIFFYFLFFLFGIAVKEEAIMIPVAALLYNSLFCGRSAVKDLKKIHLAGLAIVAVAAGLRIFSHFRYTDTASSIPVPGYIATETFVWLRYVWLAIYPAKLNVDHQVVPLSFSDPVVWLSVVVILGAVYLLWRLRHWAPAITFWGFWFFLNLLPSSVIPLNDFMAEHRAYLSLFGIAGMLGSLLTLIEQPGMKRLTAAGLSVLLLFNIGSTLLRNRVWNSELTLWADSAEKSPQKARPRINLATSLRERSLFPQAIEQYEMAEAIAPNLPATHAGKGYCYLKLGQPEAARSAFERSLELDPDFADALTGIGIVHYEQKNYHEALSFFERIYPRRKESIRLLTMMSECYEQLNLQQQAIDTLQKAVAVHQNSAESGTAEIYPRLFLHYFLSGKSAEALEFYKTNRAHFPFEGEYALKTADALIALGNSDGAREIFVSLVSDSDKSVRVRAEKRLRNLETTPP